MKFVAEQPGLPREEQVLAPEHAARKREQQERLALRQRELEWRRPEPEGALPVRPEPGEAWQA
ncbi:MAG TPA: hypothetical protein VNW28_05990 [Chthoniobacterales bacterium]|nr:hypothetical protein [Chthoniobacterales bacterium]